MREIKYRYWDGEFKKMCDVRSIVWHNNMIANIEVFDSKTIFRNPNMFYEHELLEFTGLRDKGNKPIFRGDIVRASKESSLYEYGVGKFLGCFIENGITRCPLASRILLSSK